MSKTTKHTCEECGIPGTEATMWRLKLYDHPFDDKPRVAWLHHHIPSQAKDDLTSGYESCLDLFDDHSYGEFRYFTCSHCNRMVCEQNPQNGWMSQFRYLGDEQICLRCYEQHILANGVNRDDIADGKFPGMFFSFDNHEPLASGYTELAHDLYLNSPQSRASAQRTILAELDKSNRVVIGYESLAIGGSEGYISIFVKGAKNAAR
jgi:hypothetical protein